MTSAYKVLQFYPVRGIDKLEADGSLTLHAVPTLYLEGGWTLDSELGGSSYSQFSLSDSGQVT